MIGPVEHADVIIARLAADQHGAVSRRQLLAAGVTPAAIDYRIRTRRLVVVHPRVYATGGVAGPYAREMAAALACGERGLISHISAATMWQLVTRQRAGDRVDVIVPRTASGRSDHAIRLHRPERLLPEERTRHQNVPVTTPLRTLLDAAAVLSREELERTVARAEREGLATLEELRRIAQVHAYTRGASKLRALFSAIDRVKFTRSEAEQRFLKLVGRAQLPTPAVNTIVGGYEVDFFWAQQKLVVEIDGYAYHSSEAAYHKDRKRDAALTARGIHVMRVTWRQLVREPEALLVHLAQALVHTSSGSRTDQRM